jgi:PilZ domain-containing protein
MSRQFSENGERRRASRVSAGHTVHLRMGSAYCTGRVVNLSTDGALIEVDRLTAVPGSEVSLGFPSQRGDETCWVVAVPCRLSDRMIGMRWRGHPPADVMLRIEALIVRELDPLRPAEARLAALRARALAHDE